MSGEAYAAQNQKLGKGAGKAGGGGCCSWKFSIAYNANVVSLKNNYAINISLIIYYAHYSIIN